MLNQQLSCKNMSLFCCSMKNTFDCCETISIPIFSFNQLRMVFTSAVIGTIHFINCCCCIFICNQNSLKKRAW